MIDQQFSTVYENDVNKLQGKAIVSSVATSPVVLR